MSSIARPLLGVLVAAVFLTTRSGLAMDEPTKLDSNDPKLVARGKIVYDEQCARCHGVKLEGQPDWRHRLPNGRMPAPPHDPTGHTWHHSDKQLFDMTKLGPGALVPGYQKRHAGVCGQAKRRRYLGRAVIHREHMAPGVPPKAAADESRKHHSGQLRD